MCSVFVCSNMYGIGIHVMRRRMDTDAEGKCWCLSLVRLVLKIVWIEALKESLF